MYRPAPFDVADRDQQVAMLRAVAFGHLVVVGREDRLDSIPLPFVIDGEGSVVRAHVAKANPIWKSAPSPGLLIVPGADAYISPAWYPSKVEHGEVVPTWNYEVVHVHGRIEAISDAAWLEQLVSELTTVHEAGRPQPWTIDDAPREYIERLLRAIVGIELHVDRIEAKRKLSQNKGTADIEGVVAGLVAAPDERGAAAVADAIRTAARP